MVGARTRRATDGITGRFWVSRSWGDAETQKRHNTVHDGASWSKVVERNQRVHLELCRAEQALYHGKTDSFEENAEKLEDDSNEDELELTSGRNDDTDDNERDVAESLEVRGRKTKDPAGEKDSNRCRSLVQSVSSNSHTDFHSFH